MPDANTLPVAAPAQRAVAIDVNDPVALYLDSHVFEQLQRVARLMCSAGLAPSHLRGQDKIADCFLVTAQAFRWRMDPFAVAQHTFVLSGKLGYEGKLIAAVVNSSGKLNGSLSYRYTGDGPDRGIIVSGRLKDSAEDREITGTLAGWRTSNEKWRTMPDQMLAYRGAREWARRHMPEAVLGVSAEDEIDAPRMVNVGPDNARDITPPATPAAAIEAALKDDDELGPERVTPQGQGEGAGEVAPPAPPPAPEPPAPVVFRFLALKGGIMTYATAEDMRDKIVSMIAKITPEARKALREKNAAILAEISAAGHGDAMLDIDRALGG